MKKETIREAIIRNCRKTDCTSIPIINMLRSFAIILYMDAVQRIDKETDLEILSVMHDKNILNPDNLRQFMQLEGFLSWWMDKTTYDFCKENDDLAGINFADINLLSDAWNKYAEECDAS